jgi:hypothetical protein
MFMKIITGTAVFVLTLAAPHAGLAQVYRVGKHGFAHAILPSN